MLVHSSVSWPWCRQVSLDHCRLRCLPGFRPLRSLSGLVCRCPQCGSLAPLLLWRACGVPPVLVLLAFLSFCCFFLALHCSSHVVFILAACHWRTRGTGSPSSSPPGPQADSMFRAPTGGPPSKGGAAVRFRRNLRARAGLLSKVAAGVKLKHRWGKREGSPGVNSSFKNLSIGQYQGI